jgi:hypothetical protein
LPIYPPAGRWAFALVFAENVTTVLVNKVQSV